MSDQSHKPKPEPTAGSETASQDSLADQLGAMHWLQCRVTLDLPAVRFRIEDLLTLSIGMIVETGSPERDGVPIAVNGTSFALANLESVGDKLAFRISEIL